ncbi:MAG: DUF4349 domain-containing protein, partial [Candidatus Peregrinibacteria bacterium]|nr:DUF4349 domain-containing protein [Candidatus Peregrinibacteria bacterium]
RAGGGDGSYDYPTSESDYYVTSESTGYYEEEAYYYDDYYYEGSVRDSSLNTAALSYDEYEESGVETKVIKTASLTMDVKDTAEVIDSVTSIAGAYDGFVQNSETWLQSDETTAGYITLRVDSEYFEEAMDDIKALATVIQSESISGQDVTEDYVDLQARLVNLQAEEEQYLNILDEAYTVEDLLSVSDYLAAVREDIEVIQGRLKYLENQTDYSTISIWVYEEASLLVPTSDWQPVVVAKQAFNRLVEVGQNLVNLSIQLVIFGIPLLIVIWIVRGISRAVVRNRKKK